MKIYCRLSRCRVRRQLMASTFECENANGFYIKNKLASVLFGSRSYVYIAWPIDLSRTPGLMRPYAVLRRSKLGGHSCQTLSIYNTKVTGIEEIANCGPFILNKSRVLWWNQRSGTLAKAHMLLALRDVSSWLRETGAIIKFSRNLKKGYSQLIITNGECIHNYSPVLGKFITIWRYKANPTLRNLGHLVISR